MGDRMGVKWCETHDDVALVYDDGSVDCRWELVVETHTDDHNLVELPEVRRLRAVRDAAHDLGSHVATCAEWGLLSDPGLEDLLASTERLGELLEADRG